MCEIAVLNTSTIRAETDEQQSENAQSIATNIAEQMYQSNSDGLGMIAVYPDDDADEFDYEVAKAETPDIDKFAAWLYDHADAWRIAMHARLGTAGGTGFEQTHPIHVIDDDVDTTWLMHNGVLYGATQTRQSHKQDGREFNTTVDSEVIAHEHADLPDDPEEFEPIEQRKRLNQLHFAPDKIVIRNDKYHVNDNFTMTCRRQWVEDSDERYSEPARKTSEVYVITPDKAVEMTEITPPSSFSTTTISRSGSTTRSGYTYSANSTTTSRTSSANSARSTDTDSNDGLFRQNGLRIDGREFRYDDDEYSASGAVVRDVAGTARTRSGRARLDGGLVNLKIVGSNIIGDDDDAPYIVQVRETGATRSTESAGIENARVDVVPYADGVHYRGTGTYTTNEYGVVRIPEPPAEERIDVYLLWGDETDAPTVEERYDDGSADMDELFKWLGYVGEIDIDRDLRKKMVEARAGSLYSSVEGLSADRALQVDLESGYADSGASADDTASGQNMAISEARRVPFWEHDTTLDDAGNTRVVTNCTFHYESHYGYECKTCTDIYSKDDLLEGSESAPGNPKRATHSYQ